MSPRRQTPLPIVTSGGWKQVEPQATGNWLVWTHDQTLWSASTDFQQPQGLGVVGPSPCPVAIDAARGRIFRYVSPPLASKVDYSEIRSFQPGSPTIERIVSLDPGWWLVWMLEYLPKHNSLIGLVCTSRDPNEINIRFSLGLFDLDSGRSRRIPLPREAFVPQAFDRRKNRVLFHGADGYQVLDLKGQRQMVLQGSDLPEGRGADFHPHLPILALGGRKIMLWHLDSGRFETVHESGLAPAWSADGRSLFFRESSGDLMVWKPETGPAQFVLKVAGTRYNEIHLAGKPAISRNGRLVAVNLCRRTASGITHASGTPVFNERHSLAVLDCEEKTIWQHPVRAENLAWLGEP